jgi:hypothetical protein
MVNVFALRDHVEAGNFWADLQKKPYTWRPECQCLRDMYFREAQVSAGSAGGTSKKRSCNAKLSEQITPDNCDVSALVVLFAGGESPRFYGTSCRFYLIVTGVSTAFVLAFIQVMKVRRGLLNVNPRLAIAMAMVGVLSTGAAAKKRHVTRKHVTHQVVQSRSPVIAYGFQEPQKTYTLRYYGGPKSPMWAAPSQ